MSSHTIFWLSAIAFGVWLTVHCPRAAFQEFRRGEAIGSFGAYGRKDQPFQFWFTIIGTGLGGVVGLFLVISGIGAIATGGDTIGQVVG